MLLAFVVSIIINIIVIHGNANGSN